MLRCVLFSLCCVAHRGLHCLMYLWRYHRCYLAVNVIVVCCCWAIFRGVVLRYVVLLCCVMSYFVVVDVFDSKFWAVRDQNIDKFNKLDFNSPVIVYLFWIISVFYYCDDSSNCALIVLFIVGYYFYLQAIASWILFQAIASRLFWDEAIFKLLGLEFVSFIFVGF